MKLYMFARVTSPNHGGSRSLQLALTAGSLAVDRHTQPLIDRRRAQLKAEAAQLTSSLRQSAEVTKSLAALCQRCVEPSKRVVVIKPIADRISALSLLLVFTVCLAFLCPSFCEA